ncbi:MAG: hypothetical protein OT477_00625 [Chloroflexi bacterium]|nr:hypothetical protein [Chloroflexota bacterium]
MKTIPWKIAGVIVVALLLVGLGLYALLSLARPLDLASAICQPSDLGSRYHLSTRAPIITNPYWGEPVVESHSVELVDLQFSYTILQCIIVRYADEASAQRALAEVCGHPRQQPDISVGDESCHFAGSAPRNLAFRRHAILILMSGDIPSFPAKVVDERLR